MVRLEKEMCRLPTAYGKNLQLNVILFQYSIMQHNTLICIALASILKQCKFYS